MYSSIPTHLEILLTASGAMVSGSITPKNWCPVDQATTFTPVQVQQDLVWCEVVKILRKFCFVRGTSSIVSGTGMGLVSETIAVELGILTRQEGEDRVSTLQTLHTAHCTLGYYLEKPRG